MVSNEYGGGSNWYVSKLSSEIGTLNGLSSSFCRENHVSHCNLKKQIREGAHSRYVLYIGDLSKRATTDAWKHRTRQREGFTKFQGS